MTFIFIFSYGVRVTSPELRAIVKHVSVASMEVVLMIMKDDIKERRWHLLFRKMEQIYLFGDQLLHNQESNNATKMLPNSNSVELFVKPNLHPGHIA
ncbi:hypothetical protein MTR_3g080765 [Medicago truncatula]|uniref:Uncharacterized protein n=1 Tax=Medicago truncatula TaxID=3880 RepID=A0A072V0B1_MEDTR|nr:hypothetical protein MTR_3g080765 [Medicago truncatula]